MRGDAFDTGPLDDRQRWEPDPPLPNPIPDSWPVRYETEVDHPINYLYGTVVRTGPESIEFSIADQGVVATFRPAAEPEVFC